jgi:hypothetical protein
MKSCLAAQIRFMLFKGQGSFKNFFLIARNVEELKAYRLIPLTPLLLFHFTLHLRHTNFWIVFYKICILWPKLTKSDEYSVCLVRVDASKNNFLLVELFGHERSVGLAEIAQVNPEKSTKTKFQKYPPKIYFFLFSCLMLLRQSLPCKNGFFSFFFKEKKNNTCIFFAPFYISFYFGFLACLKYLS